MTEPEVVELIAALALAIAERLPPERRGPALHAASLAVMRAGMPSRSPSGTLRVELPPRDGEP